MVELGRGTDQVTVLSGAGAANPVNTPIIYSVQ